MVRPPNSPESSTSRSDSGDDNGSVSVRERAWYAYGMRNMSELRI
jgi:hypothetical protein